jgi:hypothetical protein
MGNMDSHGVSKAAARVYKKRGKDPAILNQTAAGEVRERGLQLVGWVMEESHSLLLGLPMSLQALPVMNPITIQHVATATRAICLDPRDSFASCFTDSTRMRGT